MLLDYYNIIATCLTQTFGPHFLIFTILFTTAAAVAYFIGIVYIVTLLDKEYFIKHLAAGKRDTANIIPKVSSLTYLVEIAKIIAGICLLMLGIVMLVLPGQGLITILIGLSLLPFPGKHRLEQYILARHSVRVSLNWIRDKAEKPPFIFE